MKMKHLRRLGVLVLASYPGVALAQAPSILEHRFEHQGAPPLWVSAEMAADEENVIDLDFMGSENLRSYVEAQRRSLQGHVAKTPGGDEKPAIVSIPLSECERTILPSTHRGGDDPRENLADLRHYSQLIVRGTIRTVQWGFTSGIPSSLLGVEVSDVIKGASPPTPLYIDYSVASFKIGPLRFCNGNSGFEPRPGDEILLFDYLGPRDRDGVLYAPGFDQLFFQRQQGTLIVPPNLKNTPGLEAARSFDDIVGRLRSGKLIDSRRVGR
ncbi:MAG TPA: hypothetical protein VN493_13945 [Thermoanaerobaculia bacterium]|nr:hypothetical protein [Thermoanaerobaculia bacterium]